MDFLRTSADRGQLHGESVYINENNMDELNSHGIGFVDQHGHRSVDYAVCGVHVENEECGK